MKIAIYAPYLETCGGGEKYVSFIAEVLSKKNTVDFLVFEKPCLEKLKDRLNIDLSKFEFKLLSNREPVRWKRRAGFASLADKLRVSIATRSYDLFINQEHFTKIRSFARRAIFLCEVPPTRTNIGESSNSRHRPYPQLLKKIASNVFLDPKLRTYDKIIANSFFTKKYAERWYQKEVTVLYPPIDTEAFHPLQKRNIILNVGRFFVGAHCKNQKDTIQVIKNLFDKNRRLLEDWEYHLAGGVTDNPRSREYLNECIREAKGYPIKFHVNTPFRSLKKLYGASRILIHATGAFENSEAHPDHMEHFGMAVAEGMSAGCVPVVVSKGGLPEIVQTGVDGFLWESEQGLKEQLLMLMTDEKMSDNMSLNSMKKSHEFSVEKFQKKLKGFIDNFD